MLNSVSSRNQQTLAQAFSLSGVGLHSGTVANVTVHPGLADSGRFFVLKNGENNYQIPAQWQAVASTVLSTELIKNNQAVRTVEHLLAALVGMGIDNARIETDKSELPILDGSALMWTQAIMQAGIASQAAKLPSLSSILAPISVSKGDSFVAAIPSDCLRFSYGIEFPSAAIGQQWFSWQPEDFSAEFFAQEIAPARTFTMAKDVEYLQAQGLIKGGSLENAIVCDAHKWLNPPLRFANEPCRHKLLDLIGDLSLLKCWPQAHIIAFKASHNLHIQFAKAVDNICNLSNF